MGKKIKKMTTDVRIRKLRRKQERQSKKKRPRDDEEDSPEPETKIAKHQATNAAPRTAQVPATKKVPKKPVKATRSEKGAYGNLNSSIAVELQKEDAEIADLEAKLGLGSKKDKSRLHKEYAKLEGYGDDFGEFLDGLDNLVSRVVGRSSGQDHDDEESDDGGSYRSDEELDDLSEPDEEIIPMKRGPIDDDDVSFADSEDDDDDDDDDDNDNDEDTNDSEDDDGDVREEQSHDSDSECSAVDEEVSDDVKVDRDHDVTHTYKPIQGEDIYGHSLANDSIEPKTTKYVPPHLRHSEDDRDRQEKLLALKSLLNNALNRLSEDTLISVVQSVSTLYQDYPTSDVNECLWKNVVAAAVDRPMLMIGMIPVYVASLAGVHFRMGDTVQLGGHLIEQIVIRLWKLRQKEASEESKEASNLILCVCYLYNFGLVHAVFMFDVVRSLIESFSDLDIELLLLVLSHSGQALRSDDPLALKEIVLSVQSKQKRTDQKRMSSRVEFMISAMTDLKNNKRRKQDNLYSERTTKLRKMLGRVKAETDRSSDSSCLRIRLQDILDADTKGRWWKVGASWVGNQFKHQSDDQNPDDAQEQNEIKSKPLDDEEAELLKLAAKYRMNTDSRRAIFCIIVGSADCDDAFEKLVRSGLLKNRSERDCVRVLMECCGNEGYYNPFYSHLAARICDFQPQCKFTFQLAFWDMFKQWESVSERKAVNMAKLLYHLVAIHQSLRLSIFKPLDMADLDDKALIFMVVFFSTMFESTEEPSAVFELFERGIPKPKPGHEEDSQGLRESLSVFFMQTLKASPKNRKMSKFRSNLKAAIKACEINELDLMVPAKDME